jgi:hypothetical protein
VVLNYDHVQPIRYVKITYTGKMYLVYCNVLNAHISEALSGQLLGALVQA